MTVNHKEEAFVKVTKQGGEDFREREAELAGSENMMMTRTWAPGGLLDRDQEPGERRPLEVEDGPDKPEVS